MDVALVIIKDRPFCQPERAIQEGGQKYDNHNLTTAGPIQLKWY